MALATLIKKFGRKKSFPLPPLTIIRRIMEQNEDQESRIPQLEMTCNNVFN
jgi:hypothetical protein